METDKKITKFVRQNKNEQTLNGMVIKLNNFTQKSGEVTKYGTLVIQYDDNTNDYINLDVTQINKKLLDNNLDPIGNGDIIEITGTLISDKEPTVSKKDPTKFYYNKKLRYYSKVKILERGKTELQLEY